MATAALFITRPTDCRRFQPRVGFAWTPASWRGKTVLRGAYTISSYLEGTGTNLRLPRNPPFTPTEVTATYSTPSYQTQQGPVRAVPGDPFAGAILYVWDKTIQPAMDQQWNLTVQGEVSTTTTFQLGYVGQHGTHLMVPTPYSQQNANQRGSDPGTIFPWQSCCWRMTSRGIRDVNEGFITYNALQAVLQKRISNGLQGQVAYTWSHCLTNNSGYYGTWGDATQATAQDPYYQNLYNPHADYASCYYDSRNILSAYATYDLPIGRDKMIGKNMNSVANAVVGGWQVSSIVSAPRRVSDGHLRRQPNNFGTMVPVGIVLTATRRTAMFGRQTFNGTSRGINR